MVAGAIIGALVFFVLILAVTGVHFLVAGIQDHHLGTAVLGLFILLAIFMSIGACIERVQRGKEARGLTSAFGKVIPYQEELFLVLCLYRRLCQ